MILISRQTLPAQEQVLKYTFKPGETLHYRLSDSSVLESSGGRTESSILVYYSLTVIDVNAEGTATVTFMQDSIRYWRNKAETPYPRGEAATGIPVTVVVSHRGVLLDWQYPAELQGDAQAYVEQLIDFFVTEPPFPETKLEVGYEWQNDLTFNFAFAMTKASCLVKAKYVRQERYQGVPVARIEYTGVLRGSGGGRGGMVRGVLLFDYQKGKKLRHTQGYETQLYYTTKEGRVQARLRSDIAVDLLN